MTALISNAPTAKQTTLGTALGFTSDEIQMFLHKAAERDKAGKGWDSLFTPGKPYTIRGDHIILPLFMDSMTPMGLDARVDAVLEKHNAAARQVYGAATASGGHVKAQPQYCTFTRDPQERTLLHRHLNGEKQRKDTKLISFLENKDGAEAWLLAHDLKVEWGREKVSTEETAEKTTAFDSIKNTLPIPADRLDPNSLQVVISRDPIDIAAMSTGRRWIFACTGKDDRLPDGLKLPGSLAKEIQAGTLVAYLVHKDDTELRYPLARVLLKPFRNTKGDAILVPNEVYASNMLGNSRMREVLCQTVTDFVATQINKGKQGEFRMDEAAYFNGYEITLTLQEDMGSDKLIATIANAIPYKIGEYIEEIETARRAGNTALQSIYTKKLADLYTNPRQAAMAYLLKFRDMNINRALPLPSQLVAVMESQVVKDALRKSEIVAYLYIKSKEGWLAHMREHHPALTSLDVSLKMIGDAGAEALAASTTLTSLNVSSNNIGNAGARALAANTTLTNLDVNNNAIGDAGAAALAANTTLTGLDVGSNNIGSTGTETLMAGMQKSRNIMFYTGPGQGRLAAHLQDNRTRAAGYAAKLTGNAELADADKREIRERANAIRVVLQEQELSPDQKQSALRALQSIETQDISFTGYRRWMSFAATKPTVSRNR